MSLLATENLRVHYFTRRGTARAVDGVSLTLRKGATLGIVGESGSGKSTLGLAIMRLVPLPGRITAGRIFFDGTDLAAADDEAMRGIRGKRIGMIFQDPMTSLNPVRRILDHFLELLQQHEPSLMRDEALHRVEELAEQLGISKTRFRDFPHQFSGGMRQRAMIGLALVLKPDLLIADEPTTALDVIVEAQILELLERLKQAYRLTLILITHNVGIVAETTDQVAVMYAGKIAEIAATHAIFERPLHPYTQGLLQSVPTVRGSRQELGWIAGSPPDLIFPPSGCLYHPRCPYAFTRCSQEEPLLREVEPGHYVACHLYDA